MTVAVQQPEYPNTLRGERGERVPAQLAGRYFTAVYRRNSSVRTRAERVTLAQMLANNPSASPYPHPDIVRGHPGGIESFPLVYFSERNDLSSSHRYLPPTLCSLTCATAPVTSPLPVPPDGAFPDYSSSESIGIYVSKAWREFRLQSNSRFLRGRRSPPLGIRCLRREEKSLCSDIQLLFPLMPA